MSIREISVTIRAINHASVEFARVQTDAETLAATIRNVEVAIAVATTLRGIGSGTALATC